MRTLFLLGLLASAGCGGPPEEPEPQLFIALQRDLESFQTWEHFKLEGDGSGNPHTGFDRDLYLNKRPAKGSTEFPIGTIIVKRSDGLGDPENHGPRTFAMVKRGGDYNKAGARDWEWFELLQSDSNDPASPWQIVWRGLGPPIGSAYGASGSECNGCHAEAKANDYVQASVLQLSTLAQ
jgi:hypothetical protein